MQPSTASNDITITLPRRLTDRPASLWAESTVSSVRVPRWQTASIFAVTFAVLALFAPRIMTYLNPVTGDEPFYLMTAISIWKDGDLNECNNYRQTNEAAFHPAFFDPWYGYPDDWQGWMPTPYPLPPHPARLVPASRMCISTKPTVPLPANGTRSELYSKHGLGLSLLILPAFVAGGRELVVYFLVALGALLAANVYLLARESARRVWPALLTWLAFAFTVPQLPYSYLIFPELPVALLVLYAFRRIRVWNNNLFQVAAIGAAIAFLPWLHYRFVPVSGALFIYFVYSTIKRVTPRRLAAYALVLNQCIISAGLLMYFFYYRYRQVFPNASDHAGSSDVAGTLRGAAGLFIDVQWGLFIAAPVYILAIVGVVLMGTHKPHRRDLLWLALVFVPYFGIIANYAQFWGEWCPPARYLASILPLLAMPFAFSLDRVRNWGYYAIFGVLFVVSLGVVAGYLYSPQWMYHHPETYSLNHVITLGLPMLLRELPGGLQGIIDPNALNAALPSFVLPYFYYLQDPAYGDITNELAWSKSIVPAIVIAAIVALSLGLAWWSNRPRRATSPPVTGTGEQAATVAPAPIDGLPARTRIASGANSTQVAPDNPGSPERRDEARPTYQG